MGKIQSYRDSVARKREQACWSEIFHYLHYGKEGAAQLPGERENFSSSLARRYKALPLDNSPGSVQAMVGADRIEGIEEWRKIRRFRLSRWPQIVEDIVEYLQGGLIENAEW